MASEKIRGVVTRVIRDKGYFFVLGDDGLSRFVHASCMDSRAAFDRLREGQGVEFTSIETAPDKLRGVELRVLE